MRPIISIDMSRFSLGRFEMAKSYSPAVSNAFNWVSGWVLKQSIFVFELVAYCRVFGKLKTES